MTSSTYLLLLIVSLLASNIHSFQSFPHFTLYGNPIAYPYLLDIQSYRSRYSCSNNKDSDSCHTISDTTENILSKKNDDYNTNLKLQSFFYKFAVSLVLFTLPTLSVYADSEEIEITNPITEVRYLSSSYYYYLL